jgi:hypothetical protein
VLVGKKKSDAVRINETEHQQKILNDYTHNLHEKFRMENPEIRVSRATFEFVLLCCVEWKLSNYFLV